MTVHAAADSTRRIWTGVGLDGADLEALQLNNTGESCFRRMSQQTSEQPDPPPMIGTAAGTPSTFAIGHLAQTTVALATLAVAAFQAARLEAAVAQVRVDQRHALVEFESERFNLVDGALPPSPWGPVGGLHRCKDGYVRIHDSFEHHGRGAAELLGAAFNREDMARCLLEWNKVDFEDAAVAAGLCCVALRSEEEWNAHPQSAAVPTFPISVDLVSASAEAASARLSSVPCHIVVRKPLAGVRVLEFSRVIAAPLAGKTLALHGADVLWVTAPHIESLPSLDRKFARGKRTIQLDLRQDADQARLRTLVAAADVVLQSYRPGALAAKGLSLEAVAALNPSVVYATLSAYGTKGPWATRRGFDSLVQTVSGMNAAEAEAEGLGNPARVAPCQALDHGAGYLLAFGIMAALRKRLDEPGVYRVETSLAQTMVLLKQLGRLPPGTLQEHDPTTPDQVREFMTRSATSLGDMEYIRHSGVIEGAANEWTEFPKPLGSDKAEWRSVA
ncbi:hypothetical protein BMF94_6708 [Rhodotorula taiwanensis]|uniref:Formyl-CoA transferase n=1 Tax=Rhodotorula taiwanensis TaxID=741276 RepID=A0A2S5B0I2_9BASI|nr:hypothetical protein BMF94_6708 [Rhodotorula taiwanensis]